MMIVIGKRPSCNHLFIGVRLPTEGQQDRKVFMSRPDIRIPRDSNGKTFINPCEVADVFPFQLIG